MSYRMTDDSVTIPGKGHPEYSGKSVTPRGEDMRRRKGVEPGRRDVGSNARDVSSVRPIEPVSTKMPNLR